jgi:peptidase E
MRLLNTIEAYQGIIMGWSAGSLVQCEDYYISPDEDYPEFQRYIGLKGNKDFAVEVHYQGEPQQIESIEKYIRETGNKVYVTTSESAIIVEDRRVKLLGNAKEYRGN